MTYDLLDEPKNKSSVGRNAGMASMPFQIDFPCSLPTPGDFVRYSVNVLGNREKTRTEVSVATRWLKWSQESEVDEEAAAKLLTAHSKLASHPV
jgi:hypothetical protein